MSEKQTGKPIRGLWYELPLGNLRGFLKEPECPRYDPDEIEERKAIQDEGRSEKEKKEMAS